MNYREKQDPSEGTSVGWGGMWEHVTGLRKPDGPLYLLSRSCCWSVWRTFEEISFL